MHLSFPPLLSERDLAHRKDFVGEMRMNDAVQNLQVLVVDDSPVSRKLLEHALTAEPYALLFAKNGEEALRLFSENNPALVIRSRALRANPHRWAQLVHLHHLAHEHDRKRQCRGRIGRRRG